MFERLIRAYLSSLTAEELMELFGGPERFTDILIRGFESLSPATRERLRRIFFEKPQGDDVTIVKVQKIDDSAKLPAYAYQGDAGLDVYSAEDLVIPPGEIRLVRTGLRIALPDTHFALIKGKTGLALNSRLSTAAEVVDPNYRGEFHAILLNSGENPYEVKKGQKIVQLVVLRKVNVVVEETDDLGSTERDDKRFGSSGLEN